MVKAVLMMMIGFLIGFFLIINFLIAINYSHFLTKRRGGGGLLTPEYPLVGCSSFSVLNRPPNPPLSQPQLIQGLIYFFLLSMYT